MTPLRYEMDSPYLTIVSARLHYVATERFALDALLGRSVEHLDRYIFYISEKDISAWETHLKINGAIQVNDLGNIYMHAVPDLNKISKDGNILNQKILARDLIIKSSRYIKGRFAELKEKLPEFFRLILEQSSPNALNLEDIALKV